MGSFFPDKVYETSLFIIIIFFLHDLHDIAFPKREIEIKT